MKRVIFLALGLLLTLALFSSATAAQRTIVPRSTRPLLQGKPLYAKSWALVIGVNRYQDRRITR